MSLLAGLVRSAREEGLWFIIIMDRLFWGMYMPSEEPKLVEALGKREEY